MKGIDLRVRPIRHRTEYHVRAHVFLCMLAYYIEWRLRQALAPVLFDDEDLTEERKHHDPVAPAQPSAAAKSKKAKRITEDGLTVQSYETMLDGGAGLGSNGLVKRQRSNESENLTGPLDGSVCPKTRTGAQLTRHRRLNGHDRGPSERSNRLGER
jgi:hypothetical protein